MVGPISSSSVFELSCLLDTLCCATTFSLLLICHLKACFLELCKEAPATFNVGAFGYGYVATLGLGLSLRFDFVSFLQVGLFH